ncbi:CRISPR-associated endonuclease Cas2, partial [Lactobacillus crispatus]
MENKKGARVSRNVFKICKKYLTHVQKSVFEGELTTAQLAKLKSELNKWIRNDEDTIIIFKNNNKKWLRKEFLGMDL